MGTTTASFSTFVRPPGSPIYSPSGPSLVLPKRVYSGDTPTVRSQRLPASPQQQVQDVKKAVDGMLQARPMPEDGKP